MTDVTQATARSGAAGTHNGETVVGGPARRSNGRACQAEGGGSPDRRGAGGEGQGGAGCRAALRARRMGAGRRSAGSGRAARGAGRDPGARARADPLRAHARLAVHVLPRRRLSMAADLAGAPRTGLDVQLCGDAHLSNFGAFARARPAAGVQHQRLRRDAAGPVRVGRQAARGRASRSPAAIAASTPSSGAPINRAVTRPTARRCRSSPGCEPRPLVRAHRRRRDRRARGGARRPGRSVKRFERNVAKARSKDSLRALAKLTTIVDGEPRIVSDPPLIVPIEEIAPGRRGSTTRSSCAAPSAPTGAR